MRHSRRWIIALLVLVPGMLQSEPPRGAGEDLVGLLSKVILDVTHKTGSKDWAKATRGQMLLSGDMVKTGARSLAIIKLKDNSLVRVREYTELTVTGTVAGDAFSKGVSIERGVIGFVVPKQKPDEEFRFRSPTSVASIRGTGGAMIVAQDDTVTVIEGSVEVENLISSNVIMVEEGFTAISRRDGSLVARPSTRAERETAEGALRSEDRPRQLRLQLRNSQGETEELIIDYKEE
jgi:hypothetical protein